MGAIWPPTLPQRPQRNGYKSQYPNQLIRSDMDSGPAKVRRRGNAKPVTLSLTYVLNAEQLAVFKDFVSEAIAEGAVCFDWPHPVLNRYVRARLVGQNSSIYDEQLFGDTLDWQITFTLEYWPDAPLT